jgi:8-oxo-dGTP pyrophosphatase MutT (NUDIX family)
MIKETSAGIVLYRKENTKNLFLLLHYPSGHWDFVKGKMEKNETTHETAIRETKEETGITDIVFAEKFEEWIEYNFKYQGELVQKKVVFFLAETKTKEIKISHEHSGYIWMDYNASMEKTTFDNAKTVLTKAEKLLSNTL